MNPRQLALVIWIAVATIFGLSRRDIRGIILDIVKTAFSPRFLIPTIFSVSWNAAFIYGLYSLGLWSLSLWWDTLAFVLVGTSSLVWRMTKSKDFSHRFYTSAALQNLGFSVLVGTGASTYTFSLPVELLLVPWLVLLGGMQAVAGSSKQYSNIVKPIELLISLTGFAMLSRAVGGAIADYRGFLSIQTVQSLLLIFVLTAAYLPYLFFVRVWIIYEQAFIPLRLGDKKPRLVRMYARARMLLVYKFNLSRLEQFSSSHGNSLRWATTCAAVDDVFDAAKPSSRPEEQYNHYRTRSERK